MTSGLIRRVPGVFGRRRKVDEVKRTCNRCGHARYLPRKLAREKAPNAMQLTGAKLRAGGASASVLSTKGAAKQLQLNRLEERDRRVLENAMCPGCGSIDFTETRA
jgi:ribosomal protein S27AE